MDAAASWVDATERAERETHDLSRQRVGASTRHVHFAEHETEIPQLAPFFDYAPPTDAKKIVSNASSRRLAGDESELYFSDWTEPSPAADDYAVAKQRKRNDLIIASVIDVKEPNAVGIKRWKTYWAELYGGELLVYKVGNGTASEPKRLVLADCIVGAVDARDCILDIQHAAQPSRTVRRLRFPSVSRSNLFVWWCGLQLALAHGAVETPPAFLPPPQPPLPMIGSSSAVDKVLFLKHLQRSRRPSPQGGASATTNDRRRVTHLLLVRHGEAENVHFRIADKEKGLTKRGRKQAEITARHLARLLQEADADERNVELVFSGLQRTLETARAIQRAIPWLTQSTPCFLLEEGAPPCIDNSHRVDFRAARHEAAYELLCRHEPNEPDFQILVCHVSFIHYCITRTCGFPSDVAKAHLPIGHGSITRIDAYTHDHARDVALVAYANRQQHLKLTLRTSD